LLQPEPHPQDYKSLLKYLREIANVRLKEVRKLAIGEEPDFLLFAKMREEEDGLREIPSYGTVAELGNEGLNSNTNYATLRRFYEEVANPLKPSKLRYGIGLVVRIIGDKIIRYPLVSYPLTMRRDSRDILTVSSDTLGAWRLETAVATREYTGLEEQELEELATALGSISLIDGFDTQVEEVGILLEKCLGSRWSDSDWPETLSEDTNTISHAPLLFVQRNRNTAYGEFIGRILERPNLRSQLLKGVLGGSMAKLSREQVPYLLPLPANKEQQRIADALLRERVIKVQGPPGTGKSHTIANVMAPLLASGKQVLVLTEKPVALKAILDKVPSTFSPFILELEEERRAQSVAALVQARYDANPTLLDSRSTVAKERLEQLDLERLSLLSKWSGWASGDSLALNAKYKGTLKALTERLLTEKPLHSWFKDTVGEQDLALLLPVNMGDGAQVQKLLDWQGVQGRLADASYEEGVTVVPSIDRLPTPDQLREFDEISNHLEFDFRPKVSHTDTGTTIEEVVLLRDDTVTPEQLKTAIKAYVDFREGVPLTEWCQQLVSRLGEGFAEAEELNRILTERLNPIREADVDGLLTDYTCPGNIDEIRRAIGEFREPLGFVGTIKSKFVNAVFSKPPTLELPGSVSGVIKPNGIGLL